MSRTIYEPDLVEHWRERMRRFQLGERKPRARPQMAVLAGQEDLARSEGADSGNLIELALWLRSEAVAASRVAADAVSPASRQKSLDAAARLERASEIVKDFADQSRKQRALEDSKPLPKRA